MANIKISELNPLLTVEDADVLPIVDNAVTKKVTAAILRSYTEGNSVLLTGAQTVAGIKTFTSQLASSVATGTAPFSVASTTKVTNLNADLLDGLSSADFQATLSGTGIVKSTAGTISYLTDNTANWDTAYNDKINSAAVTGSGTNTLTLTQQDAGTITATWVNGTLIREIRNTTGATLTKGTIVYISGATGNKPTVTKAIATTDETSSQTFGFVQENILNNANGYVVIIGDLVGVDTSAFTEGDQLYLSSTVAGAFTDVKQYAPNHLVYVGIVTRAHPTLGQIEVNISNGFEMDELHNVSAQSPSNGDILQFVTSTGLWTKVAGTTTNISEGTNLYFTNARSRSAISLTTTGTSGAATYNSTTGVLNVPNYADGGITSLNGLTTLSQTFAVGTSGTDFGISSATSTHTFNLPTASATNRGALSSADWTTFNNKQDALTNPITGTGTTNYLPKFTGTSALGNSLLFDNGTNVGIGTITSDAKLEIAGLSGKIFKAGTLTNDGGWNHAFGVENGNGLFISKINAANNTAANKVASISRSDTEGGRLFLYDLLGNVTVSFKGNGASYFNSGNVLIGTSSNNTGKLQVLGDTYIYKNGEFLVSVATNSNQSQFQTWYNSVGTTRGYLGYLTNGSNVLSLDNTSGGAISLTGGNVGIATASPLSQLQVGAVGTTADTAITIGSTTTSTGNLFFGDGSGANQFRGYLQYDHNVDALNFGTSAAERMRIFSDGNIAINSTTNAGYKLDVNGTARVQSTLTIDGQVNSNALAGFHVKSGSDTLISMKYLGGAVIERLSGITFYVTENGSPQLTIASGGAATFSSSVTATTAKFTAIPTSSAGLSAGDIWNDGGTLKIV